MLISSSLCAAPHIRRTQANKKQLVHHIYSTIHSLQNDILYAVQLIVVAEKTKDIQKLKHYINTWKTNRLRSLILYYDDRRLRPFVWLTIELSAEGIILF